MSEPYAYPVEVARVLYDPGHYIKRRHDLGPEGDETEALHRWQARALEAAGLLGKS